MRNIPFTHTLLLLQREEVAMAATTETALVEEPGRNGMAIAQLNPAKEMPREPIAQAQPGSTKVVAKERASRLKSV